jgi:hypothetical protein
MTATVPGETNWAFSRTGPSTTSVVVILFVETGILARSWYQRVKLAGKSRLFVSPPLAGE